ncbi:MAG: hypothetical protein GC182_18430 [Rhodopseudomonas sp.]|nr:hypothetical protein [Rhodopseudomonas sp.]
MKRLKVNLLTVLAVSGLALSAVAATPALAESNHRRADGTDAYASAPRHRYAARTHYRSHSVYVNGEYRGSDPDPAIRQDLRRSLPAKDFGN